MRGLAIGCNAMQHQLFNSVESIGRCCSGPIDQTTR